VLLNYNLNFEVEKELRMSPTTLIRRGQALKKKLEEPVIRMVNSQAELKKLEKTDLLWVLEKQENDRRMKVRKLKME